MTSEEELILLRQENQALRETAGLLQEQIHLLQETIDMQQEQSSLQGQLIDALQQRVTLLTQQMQALQEHLKEDSFDSQMLPSSALPSTEEPAVEKQQDTWLTFLKVITFKPAYVKAKEAIMNTKPTAGEQEIEAALEQFSEEFLQSW